MGTFTIADPHNWVALFAFLAVSLVASNLSAVARARTAEALGRRDELARLFDLSRDVLMMTESREALKVIARAVARRFDLSFAAVAVPRGRDWDIYEAGAQTAGLDHRELTTAFAAAQASLEFDAHARTYAGHRTVKVEGGTIRLVPLRVGHEADRDSRGGRAPGRSRDAGHARRRRGDCDRAGEPARGAQGG